MHACAYVFICVCICTRTCRHPFVGQPCEKIRQLQSWAPGGKATSFADPPLTGQPVFQRGLVHSRLEKWTEYDSEADDDDGSGDRHCSITRRFRFYPSTQPLCVMRLWITLCFQYKGYGECTLPLLRGSFSSEDRGKDFLRNCPQLSVSLLPPLTLVWSWLIDIFLIGHDPGLESKVAAF